MTALPRIRSGLLKHPLDKQVLVYDTVLDRVHLLDPTTACVLELLEEGTHTEQAIGEQIVARLDLAPEPGFLALAIDELRRAGILDLSNDFSEPMVDVDRRELLKRVAMTGATALLIPTVASLTATRGYAQTSAPNRGACNTCASSGQCISSQCCSGICLVNCTGNAVGTCCSVGTQCTSGICTGGFCAQGIVALGDACTANVQCASNQCCGGVCRTTGCDNTVNASPCPGGFPAGSNATAADNTCCSGTRQRNGASANCHCTATVTCGP